MQPVPAPPAETAPSPAVTPAWGGAAVAGKSGGRKKSMSEIQQEEAIAAARLAKQQQVIPRSSSGGWANIAASGKASWSSTAIKPTPSVVAPAAAPISTGVNVASVSSNAAANIQHQRAKQAQVGAVQKQVRGQQQRTAVTSAVDDFGAGGRMTPALESWCKDQMRKLNGSEDLTLVAFCMTLNDPVEIRQYLTAYLGSTPQVNNFAAEFISRKGGANGKQEEWESASSTKKGRKKKSGSAAR